MGMIQYPGEMTPGTLIDVNLLDIATEYDASQQIPYTDPADDCLLAQPAHDMDVWVDQSATSIIWDGSLEDIDASWQLFYEDNVDAVQDMDVWTVVPAVLTDVATDDMDWFPDLDSPDSELLAQPTYDMDVWVDQNDAPIVWDGSLDGVDSSWQPVSLDDDDLQHPLWDMDAWTAIPVVLTDVATDDMDWFSDLDSPDSELLAQPTYDMDVWVDQGVAAIVWDSSLDLDDVTSVVDEDEPQQPFYDDGNVDVLIQSPEFADWIGVVEEDLLASMADQEWIDQLIPAPDAVTDIAAYDEDPYPQEIEIFEPWFVVDLPVLWNGSLDGIDSSWQPIGLDDDDLQQPLWDMDVWPGVLPVVLSSTPLCQIYGIRAENRGFVIVQEGRIMFVKYENRTLVIEC